MDVNPTIQPQQEAVDTLYKRLKNQQAGAKTRSKPSVNGTGPNLDLDDDTIIQKALGARNRQKFAKLWAGDISSYPSHSEADLALCRELVYWTEDPQQIDRLFRRSGLMREKWDEHPQYVEWTITKAIETPHDRYKGVSVERNGQPKGEESHSSEDSDHRAPHEDEHFKPIPPYLIKWSLKNGNALYYQKPGTTDEQQLANFMAWITEERQEDDGAEVKRVVQLEATLASGKTFSEITTSIPDFYSLAGILKALGTEAIVSPGPLVKDRIRHAIQLYSNRKKYPQRQVFTHLGWRKIDGVWRYLHAGGSIPAGVEVSPEKALESYRLPTTITLGEAIQASLRVLECAPRRIRTYRREAAITPTGL